MSLSPEKTKQIVIKGIQVNPTNIEIKEIKKIEKDGAYEEVEQVKNLIVLIYYGSQGQSNVKSDTIGTSYSNKSYSMIADYTADLDVSSRNKITFNCSEGNMTVSSIKPIVVKETICGYECSLERID